MVFIGIVGVLEIMIGLAVLVLSPEGTVFSSVILVLGMISFAIAAMLK